MNCSRVRRGPERVLEPPRDRLRRQRDAARRGGRFFCAVDLPAEVDSARAEVWLDAGVLRVVLPTEAETQREEAPFLLVRNERKMPCLT